MAIFIDARDIGAALRNARRSLYWNEPDIAKLLDVSEQMVQMYERGAAVMTYQQLQQIFTMGLMMMTARKLQNEFCNQCAQKKKS